MTRLDAETVLAAAAQWVWVPDDAVKTETDDFLLIAYPSYYSSPTQVPRTDSGRSGVELLAEVRARTAELGRGRVEWRVDDRTRPADLEPALLAAGAVVNEELLVLARPLAGWEAPPTEVDVRRVVDHETLEDWHHVQTSVFGGTRPDDSAFEVELERGAAQVRSGTGMSVVGYLDGSPVGAAGVSLVDGWARLWGGSTLPEARGRGVYRAMTSARAAWAREHGATSALVKGRVDTSAPILGHAGFTAYGEERWYLLDV